MPRLTVTMAVLNAPEVTEEALASVLRHTPDCEILIADNGSEPPTASMLRATAKADSRVKLTRHEENRGFIRVHNEMAAHAAGDYLCVLNSDVRVGAEWSERLIAALNPLVAQAGPSGGWLAPDGSGYTNGTGPIDYIEGWCFVMTTEMARRFGPFDSEHLDFAYGEDADLSFRLTEAGYSLAVVPCPITHMRYGSRHTVLPVNLDRLRLANQRYVAWRWGHRLQDLSGVM